LPGCENDIGRQDQGYAIPAGASAALRPYVEAGTKLFVARVDPTRIQTWRDGHAVLSPLRVQYDSPQFNLPVRLGLVNSDGAQDLVVHILAHETRYEAANYDNVTIPTNVVVRPEVREAAARAGAAAGATCWVRSRGSPSC
jgi:hypothetical protein